MKKYPWNEPNHKKRSWNDADYSYYQMFYISHGRGSLKEYGNIDDLDPRLYSGGQMLNVSRCRGKDTDYGNIDDLNPELYDCEQMRYVSLGRGTFEHWSNIDELDPRLYDSYIFDTVSVRGRIDIQEYKSEVTKEQYQKTIETMKENNPEWLI